MALAWKEQGMCLVPGARDHFLLSPGWNLVCLKNKGEKRVNFILKPVFRLWQ